MSHQTTSKVVANKDIEQAEPEVMARKKSQTYKQKKPKQIKMAREEQREQTEQNLNETFGQVERYN